MFSDKSFSAPVAVCLLAFVLAGCAVRGRSLTDVLSVKDIAIMGVAVALIVILALWHSGNRK